MGKSLSRRRFLGPCAGGLLLDLRADDDRLGIMCQFEPDETAARKVLAAARQAGFRRAQISLPWDRTGAAFLRGVPGWLASEGIRAEVLSAYVNCVAPETVLMSTRVADFDRAIDMASSIGATRLIAWTGGYGPGLMTPDPKNWKPEAADAICRFLEPRLKRLDASRLVLALETYITLACPDAPALRRLLDRLPPLVTAVLDPPNLTPVERYHERDQVLEEMVQVLEGRIGVVHLKDFRLSRDGRSYELPGPLAGEMNYPLFVRQIKGLPPDVPWVAEHLAPRDFEGARRRLVAIL